MVVGFDLAGLLSVNRMMVEEGDHTYGIKAPYEASFAPKKMKP